MHLWYGANLRASNVGQARHLYLGIGLAFAAFNNLKYFWLPGTTCPPLKECDSLRRSEHERGHLHTPITPPDLLVDSFFCLDVSLYKRGASSTRYRRIDNSLLVRFLCWTITFIVWPLAAAAGNISPTEHAFDHRIFHYIEAIPGMLTLSGRISPSGLGAGEIPAAFQRAPSMSTQAPFRAKRARAGPYCSFCCSSLSVSLLFCFL